MQADQFETKIVVIRSKFALRLEMGLQMVTILLLTLLYGNKGILYQRA